MKIYVKDLDCYKNATSEMKEHKLVFPERCFDLDKLPTVDIQKEMTEFILERGRQLSLLSIRSEIYPFNTLCKFLSDEYKEVKSFNEVEEFQMISKAKKWLMKSGKSIIQTRRRTSSGRDEITDAELIKYIRKIYNFLNVETKTFTYESDKWYLVDMPFEVRNNPTKSTNTISFVQILHKEMREEIKEIIYHHLSTKALGTVLAEMTAINRFAKFLEIKYSNVDSLRFVNRELLEEYLIYTNTEASGRKSYDNDLKHLKSVFITAGKMLKIKELEEIFFKDDIGTAPERIYKVYSDSELRRLNTAIVEDDEQIARALFLHQMLGTRISEILTLKRDSIFRDKSGNLMIKIYQGKTGRSYVKAIDDSIKKLFESACLYTQSRYGDTAYVFVSDKDPSKPMQYGRIQYRLMAMITKKDLRDDNGEKFRVGTHIWRHTFGRKLTEMHVDDAVIAKLLGHANTLSLKNYRKIGNEMLANETRKVRESMDEVLTVILKEWNKEEESVNG